MGSNETQAEIDALNRRVNDTRMKLDTERKAMDTELRRLRETRDFNAHHAAELRRTGGDEKTAQDFENKVIETDAQIQREETTMRSGTQKIEQDIAALETRLSSLAQKLEDEKRHEAFANAAVIAAQLGDK